MLNDDQNLWNKYSEIQLRELEKFNTEYRTFLDASKTERECVDEIIRIARAKGYCALSETETIREGDKIYAEWMGKSVFLFNIGSNPLERGLNILGAHIDSPRIDIKQDPLYEDSGFAYFDTHYYGMIKKYQWVTLPLAIHGIAVKRDGSSQRVVIGEEPSDPLLAITDLLPHLGTEQMERKASVFIEGENLDVLIGSHPEEGEDKEAVMKQIESLLKASYGIDKSDLMSAELEIVPAGIARECGLDRSMIMAYGQDDRICAYTSLMAMMNTENVKRTSCCVFVDKEEIGSTGATGMQSRVFENIAAEIIEKTEGFSELKLRRMLANSSAISSDVSSAFDPLFAEAYDKRSAAFFGRGLILNKYCGIKGKFSSNDANAEYVARVRKIFKDNDVSYQMTEMGRVDHGGGGTIAYLLALYGMNVIDGGLPILCMHAPWEISSKADIYEAYRAYSSFLKCDNQDSLKIERRDR